MSALDEPNLFGADADIFCFDLSAGLLAADINTIRTPIVQHANISDARPNFVATPSAGASASTMSGHVYKPGLVAFEGAIVKVTGPRDTPISRGRTCGRVSREVAWTKGGHQ